MNRIKECAEYIKRVTNKTKKHLEEEKSIQDELIRTFGIGEGVCQCCGNPSYGFGYVCPHCGWEQQDDADAFTGQNLLTIDGYKKLYNSIKGEHNKNG